MKKFTIPCSFGQKKAPFDVYIGQPAEGNHPLHYQNIWLREQRGGIIPKEVMESFEKLLALSKKNGVSFEDLCVYALEAANSEKEKMAKTMKNKEVKESAPVEVKNTCTVLADPEKLKRLFDDDFYLVWIVCPNKKGNISQSVLLIRAEQYPKIQKDLEKEKVMIENFSSFGLVEYTNKGELLDEEIYLQLYEKYRSKQFETSSALLQLLSAQGYTFEQILKHLLLQPRTAFERQKESLSALKTGREFLMKERMNTIKLEKQTNDSMAYLSRGYARSRLGKYELAIEDLNECIDRHPHPYAYNNRGFCYLQLNQLDAAIQDLEQSIRLDEENAYAYKNLAKYFLVQKDPISALRNLLKARELGYKEKYGDEVEQLIAQLIREQMSF